MVNFFGIRHLSPAGAYHLCSFLEEKKPKLVLIEGPSDLNEQMKYFMHPETKPPIAMLAYTKKAPIRTILYPYAQYSPEYQAIRWCKENQVLCQFIDLPSEVFLAFPEKEPQQEQKEEQWNVYEQLDRQSGEDGHETFWERTLEHTQDTIAYQQGTALFGKNLRELEGQETAETLVREAFMGRKIADAINAGFAEEEIVVVTGAYHVEGLKCFRELQMTDEQIKALPRVKASHTLMPYSYYRLSSRGGYGAGNKAPAYYSLLWKSFLQKQPFLAVYYYLAQIAEFQREHGNPVSSAEVIEAVRLATALAELRNGTVPVLRDLRDAAVTCLGKGSFSNISLAVAHTEIGSMIGSLPEGVSRTSIQEDFYHQIKQWKLEKYCDMVAKDLKLDLREKRNVVSEKSAFLDLYRSFFLHRLLVLGISAVQKQTVNQESGTWSEHWILRWTTEAEIELVEAALKGDTIEQAVSFDMKERVETASGMKEIAQVIEDAFACGMETSVVYATSALQAIAIDAVSVEDLAGTVGRLSVVISYGTIRKLNAEPLIPVLEQIFYRACLILPSFCICDEAGSRIMITAIEQLNKAALAHDFLNQEAFRNAIREVAQRDDLNTKLSGFAMAILLERGIVETKELQLEVSRRLSRGVPADLGAGWFEGLAMKNRYGLIARLSLWENLDEYLSQLNDEEFKRALVFLRRAFADFTAMEKDQIAENLGEIWKISSQESLDDSFGQQVSEAVNTILNEEEQQLVESLDDFDFDF